MIDNNIPKGDSLAYTMSIDQLHHSDAEKHENHQAAEHDLRQETEHRLEMEHTTLQGRFMVGWDQMNSMNFCFKNLYTI